MQLVYFGQKRPKTIRVVSQESYLTEKGRAMKENSNPDKPKHVSLLVLDVKSTKDYTFEPFVAKEVDDAVAKKLLDNCGDIFFKVNEAERKKEEKPDHKPKTDGIVGELAADQIKDREKYLEREKKRDLGVSIAKMKGKKDDPNDMSLEERGIKPDKGEKV